jgi:hypothetical protein
MSTDAERVRVKTLHIRGKRWVDKCVKGNLQAGYRQVPGTTNSPYKIGRGIYGEVQGRGVCEKKAVLEEAWTTNEERSTW